MSKQPTDIAPSFSQLQRKVMSANTEAFYFFVTLYRVGSIPETARILSVSLSSANRLLAKLRNDWGDPVFVRSGMSMVPTPLAKDRYEKVNEALEKLESLYRLEEIDPKQIHRTVRIACYDNAFAMIIGTMFNSLRTALPNVTFQITQADEQLFDELRRNNLDFAFFARQGLPSDIRSIPLSTTPYVCVVNRGHPLEKIVKKQGFLEKEDLAPYTQILINAQPERHRVPNGPAHGYFNPTRPGKTVMIVPFFLAVPLCVKGNNSYAIVPEKTAKLAFKDSDLSLLPFTDSAPQLTVNLAWHERTQHDPVMQLIRATLQTTLLTEDQ